MLNFGGENIFPTNECIFFCTQPSRPTFKRFWGWQIPGSSRYVKFVPLHPKNLPKGRNKFYISGRSRYFFGGKKIVCTLRLREFQIGECFLLKYFWVLNGTKVCKYPRRSMYGRFSYIYHKNQPNVGTCTIHWVFGYRLFCFFIFDKKIQSDWCSVLFFSVLFAAAEIPS